MSSRDNVPSHVALEAASGPLAAATASANAPVEAGTSDAPRLVPRLSSNRRIFLSRFGSFVAFCLASGAGVQLTGCGSGSTAISGTAPVSVPGLVPVQWPIAAPVYTTAEQDLHPIDLPADTPPVPPRFVDKYATYGYSSWQAGPGTTYPGDPSSNPNPRPNLNNPHHDLRTDLVPGYAGTNVARLLHFFSFSDIHLTDKESPAQGIYIGWTEPFWSGMGAYNITYWSPIIIATVHVLDAAVQTVNALHHRLAYDFGMSMGDDANMCQHNELRWFIDTLDGKVIVPSSGANAGAATIDYQRPFKAYGLDPSIPWYQVIGNHDQTFLAIGHETAKTVAAHVGTRVLDLDPATPGVSAGAGTYMGVVDGSTPGGDIVGLGSDQEIAQPMVAADPNRRTLQSYTTAADGTVTVTSTTRNFMGAFFDTTSTPVGHGFKQANLDADIAYYAFQPKAGLPIKVIVLNDVPQAPNAKSYANGSLDETQYSWLIQQLDQGQAADQLMIIAAHIPLAPQNTITDTSLYPVLWDPTSFVTQAQVQQMLWGYPNLILWACGHRHVNVITPQIPTGGGYASPGFWEVETPSLRDFPQGFRDWEFRRNSDDTLSILVTTVNPAVVPGTPAGNSRDHSVGAVRTFGLYPYTGTGSTWSQTYNAELVVPLTPRMQTVFSTLGTPLV